MPREQWEEIAERVILLAVQYEMVGSYVELDEEGEEREDTGEFLKKWQWLVDEVRREWVNKLIPAVGEMMEGR